MGGVILAGHSDLRIGGGDHLMPRLAKKVGQEIGIGAVVKIQLEGHGRSLRD